NTRKFLALASANLFNNPSKKLFTVAITGTKGKTSTSFMLKNILEQTSKKVGIIGTTGIIFNDTHIESDNSTPESYLLHKYMRDMLDSGIDTLVMEASSQGFKMDRTYGINFDIGIFTNLSPDHIGESEHKDFDEYLNCKKMLFSQCITGFFNCDDENFINISSNCTCKMITFGKNKNANVKYSNDAYFSENGKLFSSFDISFQAETYHFKIPLLGEISVYNSACAAAAACYLGISFKDIERGLCKTRIIGRNEIVPIPLDFTVIIDYAHNEVSTESVFKTISHYNNGRIISVFGCGGNRSRLRRYAMGDIISKNSDITIVTSDNSRFEKLDDIISDIYVGIKSPKGEVITIKDRKSAINYALSAAKSNDIVLLLGKGNQDYEEINGVKYPFDERLVVADYFKKASK
ncbi:MAG: UDP-N-acetylmuramoyl-L-alanyl-D-glutamate--2,6-diaminopimelate ligase, partial [Clostridia bacterium]